MNNAYSLIKNINNLKKPTENEKLCAIYNSYFKIHLLIGYEISVIHIALNHNNCLNIFNLSLEKHLKKYFTHTFFQKHGYKSGIMTSKQEDLSLLYFAEQFYGRRESVL